MGAMSCIREADSLKLVGMRNDSLPETCLDTRWLCPLAHKLVLSACCANPSCDAGQPAQDGGAHAPGRQAQRSRGGGLRPRCQLVCRCIARKAIIRPLTSSFTAVPFQAGHAFTCWYRSLLSKQRTAWGRSHAVTNRYFVCDDGSACTRVALFGADLVVHLHMIGEMHRN